MPGDGIGKTVLEHTIRILEDQDKMTLLLSECAGSKLALEEKFQSCVKILSEIGEE